MIYRNIYWISHVKRRKRPFTIYYIANMYSLLFLLPCVCVFVCFLLAVVMNISACVFMPYNSTVLFSYACAVFLLMVL